MPKHTAGSRFGTLKGEPLEEIYKKYPEVVTGPREILLYRRDPHGKIKPSRNRLKGGATIRIDAERSRKLLEQQSKYLSVLVPLDGEGEVERFVHKSVVHEFLLAKLGLEVTGIDTSGVSYGGYKVYDMDRRGVFPLDDKEHCKACGRKANKHKIYETATSKKLAADLWDFLGEREWIKGAPGGDERMIGVLVNEPRKLLFVTHSGRDPDSGKFKTILNGKEAKALFGGYRLVCCDNPGSFTNLFGKQVIRNGHFDKNLYKDLKTNDYPPPNDHADRNCNLDSFDEDMIRMPRCCAPKLIAAAMKDDKSLLINLGEWSMTEMWYSWSEKNKNYRNRETAESCNFCRNTLTYMLCPFPEPPPEAPLAKKTKGDSPPAPEDDRFVTGHVVTSRSSME